MAKIPFERWSWPAKGAAGAMVAGGLFLPVYAVLAFARGMPKAPIQYATAACLVLAEAAGRLEFFETIDEEGSEMHRPTPPQRGDAMAAIASPHGTPSEASVDLMADGTRVVMAPGKRCQGVGTINHIHDNGTTCAVKWDSGRLDRSLLLADLIVKKAPGGAASITELLGMTVCDAYDRVCGQRSDIRSSQQSLEQQIKPFHDLVLIFKDILKGHSRGDCPGVEMSNSSQQIWRRRQKRARTQLR